MGDTEVAPESAGDDQQTPGAAASQEPDSLEESSAPGADGVEPVSDPDTKFQGADPDTKFQG
jgi:hypothetical protein